MRELLSEMEGDNFAITDLLIACGGSRFPWVSHSACLPSAVSESIVLVMWVGPFGASRMRIQFHMTGIPNFYFTQQPNRWFWNWRIISIVLELLQRNDIAMAITKFDQFDFLIDIVPRDELKPPKRQVSWGNSYYYSLRASLIFPLFTYFWY